MPFSHERLKLIQERLDQRLSSGLNNEWELLFLSNMKKQFSKFGTNTRLSSAQYNKLCQILKLENAKKAKPVQKTDPLGKRRPKRTTQTAQKRQKVYANLKRSRPAPSRRRSKLKLLIPLLLFFGCVGIISSLIDHSGQQINNPTTSKKQGQTKIVAGENVNLREGPSTKFTIITQLNKDDRVIVYESHNGWSKISTSSGDGWMSSKFLATGPQKGKKFVQNSKDQRTNSIRIKDIRVIDGDTIAVNGLRANVRLVGFNAADTYRAECNAESRVGNKATARLKSLIFQSEKLEFRRVRCACRAGTEGTSQCNFGRFCGSLIVDNEDVGTTLIREGLAVRYTCGKTRCPRKPRVWCN